MKDFIISTIGILWDFWYIIPGCLLDYSWKKISLLQIFSTIQPNALGLQAMRSVLTLSGRLFHGPTRATSSGGYFLLLRNEAIRDVEHTICPKDWFTATEVFHQHANTDVPVEWKMIYHWNNRIAYNQVTQITQISKRCDDLNCHSRSSEASRDLMIRRLIGYWNRA